MDLGAHFHCCDLQVHSPRDLNWVGECPVNEADRLAFSAEFVGACRQKGLSAVALTDHHDVAFVQYIRVAAAAELDRNGEALLAEKRLTVFPGIELTLALPCQALVLFDPDVQDEDLDRATAALGINPAPRVEAKTAPTQRLPIDLNEVSRRLNQHERLRGRFILVPNVNDSGADTILRTNFFEHYKNMPCVGGYVDGSCAGHGRRQILDGKDPQWGNKRCGLIQTSDARERDFSRLGLYPTWIKWSAASTEALRQACLAPGSRIRYEPPLLPNNWIQGIEVSDSKYFGPFSVELNQQLNTIIGGRGSGKSTILEYLRWALCDQGYVHDDDDAAELPDFEKRRRHLVSSTLKPNLGTVTVHYVRNGVPHRIRREGATGKAFLRIADQIEQETSEEIIQSLAQIQGYSQKQLSNVSVRTQELLRLLTTPVAHELSSAEADIAADISSLRQAFERAEMLRALRSQLATIDLDLASKEAQQRSLSAGIADLPEEQKREIDAHPHFDEGARLIRVYADSLEAAAASVSQLHEALTQILSDLPDAGDAVPTEHMHAIRKIVVDGLREATTQIDAISSKLSQVRTETAAQREQAARVITEHKERYNAAASETAVVQERLRSLRSLSDQIAAAIHERDSVVGRIAAIGDAERELADVRGHWTAAITRKIAILRAQAAQLDAAGGGVLRIRVERFNDLAPLRAALQAAMAGAGITRPEKFDSLSQQIAQAPDPLPAWLELGEELLALARTGPSLASGVELPRTPKLSVAGFIDTELRRVATRLSPSAAFELALLYPSTAPIFEYLSPGGAYVRFENASPGQQATALIGLLLSQTVGPLVIDQPEDDLDNMTILDIADRLAAAKEHRQVVFSTHNPNLVVVGDSELVIDCAYRQPTTMARIHIADQGAIDSRHTCDVITKVMEGGEAAFRLRKERYGF